jgi:hypothetical protein
MDHDKIILEAQVQSHLIETISGLGLANQSQSSNQLSI